MLFLSDVDKAQVILLSSGADEQPESVQFGGSLVKVSCYTTVELANCYEILSTE